MVKPPFLLMKITFLGGNSPRLQGPALWRPAGPCARCSAAAAVPGLKPGKGGQRALPDEHQMSMDTAGSTVCHFRPMSVGTARENVGIYVGQNARYNVQICAR